MNDRRKLLREEVHYRVQYCRVDQREPHEERECTSVNANDAGVGLMVEEALNVDETVALRIFASLDKPPVQAVGNVIWCRKSEHSDAGYVVGLEFVWVGSPLMPDATLNGFGPLWSFI